MPGYTSAKVPLAPTKSETGKAPSIFRVSLSKGTSMPHTFVAGVPCAGEALCRNTYPVRYVHTLAQERRSQRLHKREDLRVFFTVVSSGTVNDRSRRLRRDRAKSSFCTSQLAPLADASAQSTESARTESARTEVVGGNDKNPVVGHARSIITDTRRYWKCTTIRFLS